jgi:hypothetical protein
LLVQSLLFVLSAGIFVWFLAGLRSYLDRAEGHGGRISMLAHSAGLTWIVIEMLVQAPQIALARTASGTLEPGVAVVMNDLGLVLATIAAVPVVVLVVAVGLLAVRTEAFPAWVGWLSAVTAVTHLSAWFGVVAAEGPLAPGGWVTMVVYPVFVVWLVAIIGTVIVRTSARVTGRAVRAG